MPGIIDCVPCFEFPFVWDVQSVRGRNSNKFPPRVLVVSLFRMKPTEGVPVLFLGVVCVQIMGVLRGATRQRRASATRFTAHVELHGKGNTVLVYLLRVLVPTMEIHGAQTPEFRTSEALAPLKN